MTINKKVGIMGGTFNPIHIGHLMAAEAARDEFSLDEVLFIPTGHPPHKNGEVAPSEYRLAMAKLAIQSNPYFNLSSIETDREGTTYTVDTLRLLLKQYPENYSFYYIIGGDTLMELDTWRQFDRVSTMCSFIVYKRPGISVEEMELKAKELTERFSANILYSKGSAVDVSSTDIREKLKKDKTVRYLIPDSVLYYINRNNLYKKS